MEGKEEVVRAETGREMMEGEEKKEGCGREREDKDR